MSADTEKTIQVIRRRLIKWWLQSGCELLFPWRTPEISPYRALITEVLLQRTRAEAVNNVYHAFFLKFPDAQALCSARELNIRKEMNSLGLLWRAKKLKELGCALMVGIPEVFDELVRLPGVGQYAAGAFLSLHRGKRAIIPDANMTRILGRIFGFTVHAETRREKKFLELCKQITPKRNFKEFNYAILDFGRTICKPVKPLSEICFLNDLCAHTKKYK